MSKKNDGGPAFPGMRETGHVVQDLQTGRAVMELTNSEGMSLRAYLAANTAAPSVEEMTIGQVQTIVGRELPNYSVDPLGNAQFWAELRAKMRVIEADALLAELERGQ